MDNTNAEELWDVEAHSKQMLKLYPWPYLALAFSIAGFSLYRIILAFYTGEIVVSKVLFIAVAIFFLTDLVSGILHIVLDNHNFLQTPVLAKMAEGFQQHHINHTLITKMKLSDHLRPMALPLFILSCVGYLIHGYENVYLHVFVVSIGLGIIWMQCSHRWSHVTAAENGKFISWLQKYKFALPIKDHNQHHVDPYSRNFCIMNGSFNPILNYATRNFRAFYPHEKKWLLVFVIILSSSLILLPLI